MALKTRTILFTSDLTDTSRHAYRYALGLAAQLDATLLLLHVVQDTTATLERIKYLFGREESGASRKESARDILIGKKLEFAAVREALQEYHAAEGGEDGDGPTCEIIIGEGKAKEVIVEVQRERRCDLVVMGVHKLLLDASHIGEIAMYVLRHSTAPVTFVTPDCSPNLSRILDDVMG